MYGAIISAEIISTAVLLILGYTEIHHYDRDEASWCFLSCVCLCLFGTLADMTSYIIADYFPKYAGGGIYNISIALSYAFAYCYFALLFRHYVLLSDLKEGKLYRALAFIRYVLYLIAVISLSAMLTVKDSIFDVYNFFMGAGNVVNIGVLALIIVIAVIYVIALKNHLEKSVYRSIWTAFLFIILNAFIIGPILEIDISYSVYAIALLLIHTLMRDSMVKLSQVEATKTALKQYENINEMLQTSYKNMEEEHKNLEAVAALFNAMYLVDLDESTYKEISGNDRIRGLIDEASNSKSMQELLWNVMLGVIRNDYKDSALAFTNLFDIKKRMKGKSYIAIDVMNQMNTTWRLMFIRVGKKSEELSKILFVTQPLEGE